MAKEEPWSMDPKPVKHVLSDDTYDDCTACRVTGSMAMITLGGWSYYSGMYNLRQREKEIMRSASKYKMGSRQLGVITLSATLVGMGLWRAFN
ncbi:hypothetical protein FQN54_000497 [Arachnomyces sp. PD_36]|nr:hypothetical protein FQN54_000497 [Arachnomyces sp. PD_36]